MRIGACNLVLCPIYLCRLSGLYRGVFARVAWLAPSAGIMITVFEFVHARSG